MFSLVRHIAHNTTSLEGNWGRQRCRTCSDHIRWYPTHDNHSRRRGVRTAFDRMLASDTVNAHFEWAFLPRLTNRACSSRFGSRRVVSAGSHSDLTQQSHVSCTRSASRGQIVYTEDHASSTSPAPPPRPGPQLRVHPTPAARARNAAVPHAHDGALFFEAAERPWTVRRQKLVCDRVVDAGVARVQADCRRRTGSASYCVRATALSGL
jgi:hypothetical protein